jgi:hypothetical protein
MYCGLEKRCRHKECSSVPKRPQQSRADSPVASAVASDTAAGLSSGPSGANGKSVMPPRGRVQPCVRPVEAALMAAGPDEVRGSDPNSLQRTRSAWTPRVSPIPGSTGLSSRLTTLHPLLTTVMHPAERDFGYMAGGSDVGLVARGYRQTIRATKLATAEVGTPRAVAALTLLTVFLACYIATTLE